jgi:hypothetical protein
VLILKLLFRGISFVSLIGVRDRDCVKLGDAPVAARRECFFLQLLNGRYASTGRRIRLARFAISQRKLPRANCMFRTITKEKMPNHAIARS